MGEVLFKFFKTPVLQVILSIGFEIYQLKSRTLQPQAPGILSMLKYKRKKAV
jgi:hypothetical protein